MSEFKCEVVRVQIEEHPNADAIEIAKVGDYQSIVRKGQFRQGDMAVYIPEQSVVPEWLLKHLGLWDEAMQRGGLSGSMGNRVKAIKLRGVLSQGLVLQMDQGDESTGPFVVAPTEDGIGAVAYVGEGDDVAEFLGIVKYEPTLPSHMRGRIVGVDYEATAKYDFEDIKKAPAMFDDGEEVVVTEKIHGTLIQVGVVPSKNANERYFGGRVVISSKGMGAKGFVLDHTDETNLYVQAAKKHGLLEGMLEVFGVTADFGFPIFIFGEVFGRTSSGAGVQDLTYTDEVLDFRAFDIAVGNRGSEHYLAWDAFVACCEKLNVKPVPLLYRGPYSKSVVLEHTNGGTTLMPNDGKAHKIHIREGVVVKSAVEDCNPHYGRKIAKSRSEAYLLRKGNVTEFQ